jgi:DHA1 family multidrug resistance protein-like MFS transporter
MDEVESTVPSGRAGAPAIPWRRNLYAIAIAQFLAVMGFSLRAPFLPFFIGDLGVTSAQDQALWAGLINAAGAGVMAISAPIWGVVADRRGRRPMLLRAMFASVATVGLMAFAVYPWHLLALRLIEGSLSGTVTAATTLVATTSPKARLGYTLGTVQTAIFAGASLGPLVGGFLASLIGPRPTFLVASGFLAVAGLIVLFAVRENFVPAARAAVAAGVGRLGRVRASVGMLIGGAMLTLVTVLFVVRAASMSVQPIIPLYIAELAPDIADPSALAGLTMGALGFTSAASAMTFGRIGDRRGHWPILLGCIVAAGLLYIPMAFVQQPWQLIVLQGLFGLTAGGLIPSANALIANLTPPERRGAMYGLTASAGSLGGFIGPLAGATIAAATSFRTPFLVVGVMLLLLAVPVFRATRNPPSPAEPELEPAALEMEIKGEAADQAAGAA